MKKLLSICFFTLLTTLLTAQVSKIINVTTAGTLFTILTSEDKSTVTNLTLTGTINAQDFLTMRDNMYALTMLDISKVNISAYTGYAGTATDKYYYPENLIPKNAFANLSSNVNNSYITSITLPTSITSIGDNAFYQCSKLTSLTIPSFVKTIRSRAFYNCSGLTTVSIPTSVDSIGSEAFEECSGLTSLSIPASVTFIGSNAFLYCSGLISVDKYNSIYSSVSGVLFNKEKTILISYPISKTGSYDIPSSVKTIEKNAFYSCTKLTSISIPSSVTTIGIWAFEGCSGLTTISIPSSVTIIGDNVFYQCSKLTSVSIPSSIETIGKHTFAYCYGLTSISIPSSVTSIGDGAFEYCYGLTSVYIPSPVTYIGESAFSTCVNLTSISIPSSVTFIGSNAFYLCSALTSIYSYSKTPVDLHSTYYVFFNVNKNTCTLNVPVGSKSSYKALVEWKDFTNIVENLPNALSNITGQRMKVSLQNGQAIINGVTIEGTLYIYNIQGKAIYSKKADKENVNVILPTHGLYVIKMGEQSLKVLY